MIQLLAIGSALFFEPYINELDSRAKDGSYVSKQFFFLRLQILIMLRKTCFPVETEDLGFERSYYPFPWELLIQTNLSHSETSLNMLSPTPAEA